MSNKTEWLVIKTNKDNAIFTQVVEASELNEALNQAEENFDWERQADIFATCRDGFYELCYEFGLEDVDIEPDDIQAFPKELDVDIDSFYEQQEHERHISQSNAELERGKREVEEWRENRQLLGHDMAEAIAIQRELEEGY